MSVALVGSRLVRLVEHLDRALNLLGVVGNENRHGDLEALKFAGEV